MDKSAHASGAAAAPGLSERQRRRLRARAHALKPVIRLGSAGLTAAIARETERALRDHELIKVKAPGGDRAVREEVFVALARHTGSTLVQRIGNVAVLYRPRPELPGITSRTPERARGSGGRYARYSKRTATIS